MKCTVRILYTTDASTCMFCGVYTFPKRNNFTDIVKTIKQHYITLYACVHDKCRELLYSTRVSDTDCIVCMYYMYTVVHNMRIFVALYITTVVKLYVVMLFVVKSLYW